MATRNPILALADRQRGEIERADAEALRQLIAAYGVMYERMGGDIDALILAIEAMEDITRKQVQNSSQYKRLLRNAEKELERFQIYLETVVTASAATSIGLGLSHSAALVNAQIGGGFTSLEPGVIRPLLQYLDPGGGLYASLQRLTGNTVDAVVQSIVDGVLAGHNPRKIARAIQGAFGRGLTDALRNTRTVQIWSYRDSARANYTATGGIVQGWVWYARLDGLTCMSCVSQHGSIHELSETLDDHDNGRCAPLPYIPEFGNPVQQRGQDWFSGLPQAEQKKQMGASKWQAWQDDKFQFDQLSHQRPDDRYGTMRSEASLKQLVGEQ